MLTHPAVLLALPVAHDRAPRAGPLGAVLVLLKAAGEGPAIDLYRVTHQDSKKPLVDRFGMFHHLASTWALGSYSNSPSAARTVITKSTRGFYSSDVSPCSGI